MEIIAILVGTAAGVAYASYRKKKKDGNDETEYGKVKNANQTTFFSTKKEHEKDLIDFMKEIAYGDEIKNFKLVEKFRDTVKYGYRRNKYLFTVFMKNGLVTCIIESSDEDENVVEFEYDQYWNEFPKKKILRSVIENYSDSEAVAVIEDFMKKVAYQTDWKKLSTTLNVVDNLKDVSETKKETSNVDEGILSKIDSLIYRAEALPEKDLSKEFIDVLKHVREANVILVEAEIPVPIDVKRNYEKVIIEDITKLLDIYGYIEGQQREEYKPRILETLSTIKKDSEEIIALFKEQKGEELDTLLQIINRRHRQ